MTLFLTLAASVSALIAPTDAGTPPSVEIQYRDLDLATAEGQKQLKKRVDAAERATCKLWPATGSRVSVVDPECASAFRQIVDGQVKAAISKAQARADNAQATADRPAPGAAQ